MDRCRRLFPGGRKPLGHLLKLQRMLVLGQSKVSPILVFKHQRNTQSLKLGQKVMLTTTQCSEIHSGRLNLRNNARTQQNQCRFAIMSSCAKERLAFGALPKGHAVTSPFHLLCPPPHVALVQHILSAVSGRCKSAVSQENFGTSWP